MCAQRTTADKSGSINQYGGRADASSTQNVASKTERKKGRFHNLIPNFQEFEMDKGGRLFQNIIRAAARLNRLEIRHKTHDMVAWKMSAPLKGTLSISIKSPYSVKVEAMNPMEYIENEDPNVQAVKGHVYLQTNGEEDLGPEVKTAFQKDIQYNVRSDLASSSGFLEVNISNELLKGEEIFTV